MFGGVDFWIDYLGADGGSDIQLSDEFINTTSNNGTNYMDCTIMQTDDNIYGTLDIYADHDHQTNHAIWNACILPYMHCYC